MRGATLSVLAICLAGSQPAQSQYYYPPAPPIAPYYRPPPVTLVVCEGEFMGPCGNLPATACGTVDAWAFNACASRGLRYMGKQQTSSRAGNRCGYGVHSVFCG
jgi:hypothetical protein